MGLQAVLSVVPFLSILFALVAAVSIVFWWLASRRRIAAAETVDRARAEGLTIVPWCPYARHWLRGHPDATRAVSIDWHTPAPSRNERPEA